MTIPPLTFGHANGTSAPRVKQALYDPNMETLRQLVRFAESGCAAGSLNKFQVEHLLACGMAVRSQGKGERIMVTAYGLAYAARNPDA